MNSKEEHCRNLRSPTVEQNVSKEQDQFIKNLAAIHSMLMTTFDDKEKNLIKFFLENEHEVNDFYNTVEHIKRSLFTTNILSTIDKNYALKLFHDYSEQHSEQLAEANPTPITFTCFKSWFTLFKSGKNDMRNIPNGHPIKHIFPENATPNDENMITQIIEALNY
jgi:hypothetical protein